MSVSQSRKHNRVGDTTHFRLRKRYKSHTSRRTLRSCDFIAQTLYSSVTIVSIIFLISQF